MHSGGGLLALPVIPASLGAMDDLRISLSDRQQAFVEEQVASGAYADASEYFTALVRADEKAKAQEKLEALLLEALDEEGDDREWTPELIEQIRDEAKRISS